MSWQARLLANMDGKQTKDSFNHTIVSTFSCTQGPAMPLRRYLRPNRKHLATLKHSLDKEPIIIWFGTPSNTKDQKTIRNNSTINGYGSSTSNPTNKLRKRLKFSGTAAAPGKSKKLCLHVEYNPKDKCYTMISEFYSCLVVVIMPRHFLVQRGKLLLISACENVSSAKGLFIRVRFLRCLANFCK